MKLSGLRRVGNASKVPSDAGQALPLAAISILVLALLVLATANLGQAVHERIKLQNTADSAAYSLAAMEARTFNYIAFLNRAQIAHYNTAMVVQSYITWVGYQVSLAAAGMGWYQLFYKALSKGAKRFCSALGGQIAAWCETTVKALRRPAFYLQEFLRGYAQSAVLAYKTAAQIGHQIVEAMQIFNHRAVWQTQAWRAVLTNASLASANHYVAKNDPDPALFTGASGVMTMAFNAAANLYEYYQAFDTGAGMSPFSAVQGLFTSSGELRPTKVLHDANLESVVRSHGVTPEDGSGDREVAAYRLMAELCNASRWPAFVYNRRDDAFVGGRAVSNKSKTMKIINRIVGKKFGQTRFVGTSKAALSELATKMKKQNRAKIDRIDIESKSSRNPLERPKTSDRGGGNYTLGVVLASDDFLKTGEATLGGSAGEVIEALIGVSWNGKNAKRKGKNAKKLGDAILAYEGGGAHYQVFPGTHPLVAKGKEFLADVRAKADRAIKAAADFAKGSVAGDGENSAPNTMADADGKTQPNDFSAPPGTESGGVLVEEETSGVAVAEAGGDAFHAPWPGFAPYFKFRSVGDSTRDFNQPSTWIVLSKPYRGLSQQTFSLNYGGASAHLDTAMNDEKTLFLFSGLNVIARAMVYYHRPGAWEEQPNFFNPFWRARLAPVAQRLQGMWQRWVTNRLELRGSGSVIQGLMAGVRNTQMDIFTGVATTLVSH